MDLVANLMRQGSHPAIFRADSSFASDAVKVRVGNELWSSGCGILNATKHGFFGSCHLSRFDWDVLTACFITTKPAPSKV